MDLVDAQRSQEDFSPSPKVQFPYFKQSAVTLFSSKAKLLNVTWCDAHVLKPTSILAEKRSKLWELFLLSYKDNLNDNSIKLLHCWLY